MGKLAGTDEARKPRRRHVEPVDPNTFTDLMEQLQEGYVSSVAATAGFNYEIPRKDNWGIDGQFIRPSQSPDEEEKMLYVQLKATTQISIDGSKEYFSYQFTKRKYFEDLAKIRSYPKAILVVMAIPQQQYLWTEANHPGLLTRHCCYWVSLEGMAAKPGVTKPTVRVPTKNIFDANALIDIVDRIDRGESLHE